MTTLPLLPHHLQPTKPTTSPSQSKTNPFARPKATHQSSSFSRSVLLPTISLPLPDGLKTPREKVTTPGVGSTGRVRSGWRILWRGGFEIGDQGYRLDGITFFANLVIPQTPSVQISNPFDDPALVSASPFTDSTADLCLSLESMRGRKYMQVRGVVELGATEVLEGEGDDGGVQMSVAPEAVLLSGYLTGLLCRTSALSPKGRTLTALSIGLGDEVTDSAQNSTILIYGQLRPEAVDGPSSSGPKVLRLCVGRRKPKVSIETDKKIRPGDPLPRTPLFLPITTSKPPLAFPQRNFKQTKSRTFTRAPSVSSIYHPPLPPPIPAPAATPISGRTPGRRGEKRKRSSGEERHEERMRRAGRVVLDRRDQSIQGEEVFKKEVEEKENENGDIFGKIRRGDPSGTTMPKSHVEMLAIQESAEGSGVGSGNESAAPGESGIKIKRIRVPQQILDNKATIRKQTLLILEERGYPRNHEIFKDVFGMTTKGVYFALRDKLESGPITKTNVHVLIHSHLDMYLPEREFSAGSEKEKMEDGDVIQGARVMDVEMSVSMKYESSEGLGSLKEEDEEDELIKLEEAGGFG